MNWGWGGVTKPLFIFWQLSESDLPQDQLEMESNGPYPATLDHGMLALRVECSLVAKRDEFMPSTRAIV